MPPSGPLAVTHLIWGLSHIDMMLRAASPSAGTSSGGMSLPERDVDDLGLRNGENEPRQELMVE